MWWFKKPNETEQSVEVSYKQLRAKTDIEKCEMFKTLLQDTMKDHIYENLELNEHFEKVETETKIFLQYENTEPNNYCIIKVEDYEENLNKTRRSSPGPDKTSYNILKSFPKSLKAYISQNVTKAEQKQKRWRKLPTNQPNQLHCKNLRNSSKEYCPSALWRKWCLRWNAKWV